MGAPNKRDVGRKYELEMLVRLSHRLSRHLSDHLRGEHAAIDDVAAVLRTLCAKGKGDKLIQRVVNSFALEVPHVWVADVVEPVAGTLLEMGGLPSLRAQSTFEIEVTFLQWLDTKAIVSAHQADKPWPSDTTHRTWAAFINDLANVRGSHATETIASWIDTASIGHVHAMSLADFVVETVAAVTEDVLAQLLPQLGHAQDAPARRLIPVRATGVTWLRVEDPQAGSSMGGQVTLTAHAYTAGLDRVGVGRHPVVRVAIRGVQIGMDVVMNSDGSARYEPSPQERL